MEYENPMMNHYHGTNGYDEQQYEQTESKESVYFMIIVLLGMSFLGACANFFSSSNDTLSTSDINRQLLQKINSSTELYKEDKYYDKECVICLDIFKKDEQISKLQCNHIYHTECIKSWFTNNLSCPMCRRIII
jgi:hypothetical protein